MPEIKQMKYYVKAIHLIRENWSNKSNYHEAFYKATNKIHIKVINSSKDSNRKHVFFETKDNINGIK